MLSNYFFMLLTNNAYSPNFNLKHYRSYFAYFKHRSEVYMLKR